MKAFVLDCSAAMAYFFKDESSDYVDRAFEILSEDGKARVPSIWPLEVMNTCLSAERRKRISGVEADRIFSILSRLPIYVISYPDFPSMESVMSTARFFPYLRMMPPIWH